MQRQREATVSSALHLPKKMWARESPFSSFVVVVVPDEQCANRQAADLYIEQLLFQRILFYHGVCVFSESEPRRHFWRRLVPSNCILHEYDDSVIEKVFRSSKTWSRLESKRTLLVLDCNLGGSQLRRVACNHRRVGMSLLIIASLVSEYGKPPPTLTRNAHWVCAFPPSRQMSRDEATRMNLWLSRLNVTPDELIGEFEQNDNQCLLLSQIGLEVTASWGNVGSSWQKYGGYAPFWQHEEHKPLWQMHREQDVLPALCGALNTILMTPVIRLVACYCC